MTLTLFVQWIFIVFHRFDNMDETYLDDMINTIVTQTYYCLDISKWRRFGTDSPTTPTTYFLDFFPRNMRRLLTNTQNSQRLKWETSPCQCKNIKHAGEISAKSAIIYRLFYGEDSRENFRKIPTKLVNFSTNLWKSHKIWLFFPQPIRSTVWMVGSQVFTSTILKAVIKI